MKITLDTKEDSHEEIRKVIAILEHVLGEHTVTNQPVISAPIQESPQQSIDLTSTPIPQIDLPQSTISEPEAQEPLPTLKELMEKKDDDMKKQFQIEEYY